MSRKKRHATPVALIRLLAFPLALLIFGGPLFAQNATGPIVITGIVKDKLNKPLDGVSVELVGTKRGASTDSNGHFSITVDNARQQLKFSRVGFVTQVNGINNSLTQDVVLDAVAGSLDEVVLVGYGKQKKISLVGAQSSVNVEELKLPVANLSATLAGRIAGLVGVQRTGLPGSNQADLWIRGISTFNSSNDASPLIIVDGVQGRDLNSLDPEDISSFTILKDASATAVYGVAGANGVVLIQTKKGRPGKPNLMFNFNEGLISFTKTPQLADAKSYMTLRNEAEAASGFQPEYSQAYIDSTLAGHQPYLYPNVNWMKTLFKSVSDSRRANFSARGGSETANYYVSLAYYDEKSLLRTDNLAKYNADTRFKRYNFTSNVNMDWTKTTKFELGIQGYITNTNYPGINPQNAFADVMQTNPVLYPVKYPGDIVPGVSSAGAQPNPWAEVTQSGYENIASNQVNTNARVTQDLKFILPGLSAYGLYSYDRFNQDNTYRTRTRSTYYIDQSNPYNADGSLNLNLISTGSDNLTYTRENDANRQDNTGHRQTYIEAAINYDHDFGSKSHITGLVLYNQKSYADVFALNLTASLPFKSQGVAGRVTYSWAEKYFGEFNFGYNGSENFAPQNRYGFFPSLGVGWILSKEKFFEPLQNAVQFFKLRYSNGVVGSPGGGRRFGYLTLVSDGANGYSFGNASNSANYGGVAITDYGTNVKWARSHKQDVGAEIKTLDSKVSLIVDYFSEHRTGVFLQRGSLADYVGLQNSPWGNIGIIDNKGFDGTLDISPFSIGKTSWTIRGTFSYNRDKVIENDDPVQPYPYMERRGVNYLSTFGYVAEGLFKDQHEIDNAPDQSALGAVRPGDIRYKDLNGDGKIDANDVKRIGNGDVPNWVYGFGFTVNWKQWYFGAFFQGVASAQRQLGGDGIIPFNNSTGPERSNLFAIANDRWTVSNPNPNAFYPRLAYGNAANKNNAVTSTWWEKDISFIRLKTLDFGYNLPRGTLKSIGLKNGRIYVQGVNLFYLSKFKLWDPELNTTNGAVYPNTRNVDLGLQVNF